MLSKRVKQFLMVVGGGFLAAIILLWLAIAILRPGPNGRIVIAAAGGGGSYAALAESWQDELAKYGVELVIRPDMEGARALQSLFDAKSGIDGAIIKGGLAGSLQGRYVSNADQQLHDRWTKEVQSIGRLFIEPLWVFYRGPNLVRSIGEFKGKRIMVGGANSGTKRIATLLLRANGITPENSKFIEQEFPSDGKPLTGDGADVAFVSLPPDSKRVQDLLRTPGILLMDFSAEDDAYLSRFPFLTRAQLYRGAVEFDPDIPSADITLLATNPALVVRRDLHPAIVSLLTHAVAANPRPGFDASGEPVLFYKAGQFPHGLDPEYEVDPDARAYYKTGELPIILRSLGPFNAALGTPFWVTAFAFLNATKIVLLAIPVLSIAIPLSRFLPMLYTYMIRQRLLQWYDKLKAIEFKLDHNPSPTQVAELTEELKRIDRAVSRLRLPRNFSDQIYDLRGHIDLVEQRLTPRVKEVPQTAAAA
jgi:TRAP-type uncharacterized transport system substrate-binding protein